MVSRFTEPKEFIISELTLRERMYVWIQAKMLSELAFSNHRFEVAKRKKSLLKYNSAGDICLRRAKVLLNKGGEQERKLAKMMLLCAKDCFENLNSEKKLEQIEKFLSYVEDVELTEEEIKEGRNTSFKRIYGI
ncbi:MAG: hypothetical protein WC356_01400 [Candidatus Micrarchaeia archaeon]